MRQGSRLGFRSGYVTAGHPYMCRGCTVYEFTAVQRVVLYAAAGANASAIASVLSMLYETLGYGEAVILATSVSKKYADAAIKLVKSVLGSRERLRVECGASSCIMGRAPDEPSDVVNMLVGELKKILGEDGTGRAELGIGGRRV